MGKTWIFLRGKKPS